MSAPSNNFAPGKPVEPPNNPGTFIGRTWRAKICGLLTCFSNPKIRAVVIPSDGSPHITVEAEIIMAANGWTATLDLTKVAGSQPAAVGIQWQSPNKELDPRSAVPVNTWVYITSDNPISTVGLTDTDSGLLVSAPPGKWLSVQDVPAQATDGTYHVPQLPYPGATGEVTGTPLAGDLDNNPLVYWVLESPAPVCFS